MKLLLTLRMWILPTLLVACAKNRDDSLAPAGPPPLTAAQAQRVRSLYTSVSDIQSITAQTFPNLTNTQVGHWLFDDIMREVSAERKNRREIQPPSDRKAGSLPEMAWKRNLNTARCKPRSVSPTSASVLPEAGYFYFIADSSSCPVRMESRLQVIRSAPESQTAAIVMTLRYSIEINDPAMRDEFDLISISFDGDVHIRKGEQDFEVSGYSYGSVQPLDARPVAVMMRLQGSFAKNHEPRFRRRTRFEFEDFIAELPLLGAILTK